MYNLTASIFFHARLIRERQLFLDPNLRYIGDLEWMRRVVETGAKIVTSDFMTSTFSDVGTNMALSTGAAAEAARTRTSNSPWRKLSSAALVASHRLSRLLAGHYRLRPFDYAIYTPSQEHQRQTFHVAKPTGVWHNRL